jgi:dihydroorotate dehydrogenase (NAD+) catalytic subunit
MAREVMTAIRPLTGLPLIAKLTPNVTRIAEIAEACEECGADAISLVNTPVGMAVDIRKRKPVLGTVTGGLSGPAIKPLALAKVWEVVRAVDVPVIGMGGIGKPDDVIEFLLTGATAVQIGTALFADPGLPQASVERLQEYLGAMGARSIREMLGALETPPQMGAIRAGLGRAAGAKGATGAKDRPAP